MKVRPDVGEQTEMVGLIHDFIVFDSLESRQAEPALAARARLGLDGLVARGRAAHPDWAEA